MSDKLNVKPLLWLAVFAQALGLSACVSGRAPSPPPKPFVPPQVVYRIDANRYFELTPDETCAGNILYFVDKAKGVRSGVVKFDAVMNHTTLVIDAANDQYLVAPVTRGGTNRSSGGGGGGDSMPYSTDGGRTWEWAWSPGTDYDLMVSGSMAYQTHVNVDPITQGLDLTLPQPQSNDWKYLPKFIFKPRIAPLDTKVRCSAKTQGQR